ncbi:MAG: hypothetical protein QM713_09165 [Arachnia sp.]
MNQDLSREDLHAALGVRQEMGAEIEPALVDSLAAKVEATVQRRYQAELEATRNQKQAAASGQGARMTLGIVSLGVAIPLTAIAGDAGGFFGMLLAWTGIVLVNLIFALRGK